MKELLLVVAVILIGLATGLITASIDKDNTYACSERAWLDTSRGC